MKEETWNPKTKDQNFVKFLKTLEKNCFQHFKFFRNFAKLKKITSNCLYNFVKFFKIFPPFLKFCRIYIFYSVNFLIYSNLFTISSKCHNFVKFFKSWANFFFMWEVFSNRYDNNISYQNIDMWPITCKDTTSLIFQNRIFHMGRKLDKICDKMIP